MTSLPHVIIRISNQDHPLYPQTEQQSF